MPIHRVVPARITDLNGEVKDGMLFLSFTVPAGNIGGSDIKELAGFKIFKGCDKCSNGFGLFKDLDLKEQKGYLIYNNKIYLYDDGLVPGVRYEYKVYPYTTEGTRGEESNIFSITWDAPPERPEEVNVRTDDRMVELSWRMEPDYLYNVYRYVDGVYPLIPLNSEPLSTSSFVDMGLENGKTYFYEVRKVKLKGNIRYEGEGTKVEAMPMDKTPPAPPYGIEATKRGKAVVITWIRGQENDLAGYNVYRIIKGEPERLNEEPVTGTEFIDENPPDLRYIAYAITAVDASGNESEKSREVVVLLQE